MGRQVKIALKNKQHVKEEVISKTAIFECLVKTPDVFTTPAQLKPCKYDCSPFVDVEKIDQKNVLNLLRYARFNLGNPLPILRTKLNKLNLDLIISTKHSRLFMKLQHRLYDVLRHSEYCKYALLIMKMKRYDFVWQIGIMWDILENTKHSQGTYPLLVDLISNRIKKIINCVTVIEILGVCHWATCIDRMLYI